MHRAIPVSNKILSKKWEENNQRIHTEKLKNMQSRVKSSKPTKLKHLKFKAKKEQMLEDRFTEIERENRILLEKMSSIMNKKKREGKDLEIKSLNKNSRKEEMRRITLENQALLKRLQERSPCYNTHQWDEDRRQTEKRLQNMCEFPYLLGRDSSTPVTFKRPRKLSPISKLKVFKRTVDISGSTYKVEVIRSKKNLIITVYHLSTNEKFSLTLATSEAFELMGGAVDYQKLVDLLDVENGEIVLVNNENAGFKPDTKDPKELRKKHNKTENFGNGQVQSKEKDKDKEKAVGKSTDMRIRESASDEFEDDYEDQEEVEDSDDDSAKGKGKTADFSDRKEKNLKDKIEIVDRFFGFETNVEGSTALDLKNENSDERFVMSSNEGKTKEEESQKEEVEKLAEGNYDEDLRSENKTEEIEKLKSFEEVDDDVQRVEIPEDNQSNLGDENEDIGSAGIESDHQDD